jgi:hypothetical protein
MISKAQAMALTAGDSWLEKGANLLLRPAGSRRFCHQINMDRVFGTRAWREISRIRF